MDFAELDCASLFRLKAGPNMRLTYKEKSPHNYGFPMLGQQDLDREVRINLANQSKLSGFTALMVDLVINA
jgi:hypothetical protein